MTLIRWSPTRALSPWRPVTDFASEFVTMQREIDRMFDRFQGGVLDRREQGKFLPATDIVERENEYVVSIELPGVAKSALKISLKDDILTVSGEKKSEDEKNGESYRRVERSLGSFERSFTLPATINSEQIEASLENGILRLALPKNVPAKPAEREVKVK